MAVFGGLASPAWQQGPVDLGTALAGGQRVLRSDRPQYFNADRKIRVEYANIVVTEKSVTLYFEAAAMVRAKFPGRAGPWVLVALSDRDGRVIGDFQQVQIASVDACGGYQRHEVDLMPRFFSRRIVEEAAGFTIRMPGGTDAQRC